jgi:hypothetical protein
MRPTPRSYVCVVAGCTDQCRHPTLPGPPPAPRRPVSNHLGPMAWVLLALVIVVLLTR